MPPWPASETLFQEQGEGNPRRPQGPPGGVRWSSGLPWVKEVGGGV